MRNKRVPKGETGAIPGDYGGSISDKLPSGPARQTSVGTSGSGMAPKPSGGAAMFGNDRPSHSAMHGLARVNNRPSSPTGKMPSAGSFTPVQNSAMANLTGQMTGQAEVAPRGNSARQSAVSRMPVTSNPVATNKSKRRGKGAAFFGEY